MFSRSATQFTPICTQVRGMATLKDLATRLKAVKNIQKITKSMKLVSAAKYARAEKDLKPARVYGRGALAFFEKAEVTQDEKQPNHLIIAMTSDRGLCGAVHTNVVRAIRARVASLPESVNYKIICVGDKSRAMLARQQGKNILMHFSEIGRKPPTFIDASTIAQEILNCGFEYDYSDMYYNVFRTVVSYDTKSMPIYSGEKVAAAEKLSVYDDVDEDVLTSYNEFSLVSRIAFALKECATSEQSARMTAMDAASKNAGEMIDKLTLTYNRTRQAVITKELIEIISGAAALD